MSFRTLSQYVDVSQIDNGDSATFQMSNFTITGSDFFTLV